MNLIYNILWFDNSLRYVETEQELIHIFLDDLGFDLNVIAKEDDKNLSRILDKTKFDLILIDHNLIEKKKGDKIVEKIRRKNIFTEILYYSQDPKFQREITRMYEGIYYSIRDNLEDKIKDVINVTLHKFHDINNQRGLFISSTIDMENTMEEIVIKIMNLTSKQIDIFKEKIVETEFFTCNAKYQIILKMLKTQYQKSNTIYNGEYTKKEKARVKPFYEKVKPMYQNFCLMQEQVIKFRNKLAHVKVDPTDNEIIRDSSTEILLNFDKCKDYRILFKKHHDNMSNLLESWDEIMSFELNP